MISLDDWAEIRRLSRVEGLGIKTIARRLGVARNTVRAALSSDAPPRYERARGGSAVDEFVPAIKVLLVEDPLMPASVIARRVGWTRSGSVFRARVAELRPLFVGVDPVDRTEYRPGEVVQCDLWFPNTVVPVAPGVGVKPPVLTMVAAWCGFIMAWMVPSRSAGDLLSGMWHVISTQLGGVPARLVWDHETAIGRSRVTDQAASFAGTLGCKIVQVRPGHPEHKGVVERANGFLETSFEPGRRFASPADFNAQLVQWLPEANQRVLRRTGQQPGVLIQAERESLAGLPPIPPAHGTWWTGRLGRDYYVRLGGNDYSVDPQAIGRMVDARMDLDHVRVTCDGQEVGLHQRLWTTRGVSTDPAHKAKAAVLRAEHEAIKAKRAASERQSPGERVALRLLSSYDELFDVPDLDRSTRPHLGVVE